MSRHEPEGLFPSDAGQLVGEQVHVSLALDAVSLSGEMRCSNLLLLFFVLAPAFELAGAFGVDFENFDQVQ